MTTSPEIVATITAKVEAMETVISTAVAIFKNISEELKKFISEGGNPSEPQTDTIADLTDRINALASRIDAGTQSLSSAAALVAPFVTETAAQPATPDLPTDDLPTDTPA